MTDTAWWELYKSAPARAMALLHPRDNQTPHWLRPGKPGTMTIDRKRKAKDRKRRKDAKRQRRAKR